MKMMSDDVKKVVSAKKAPVAIGPYSQAIKFGKFLFISGQIPVNPATNETVNGPIEDQVVQVISNIKVILEAAGMELTDIVKTTLFLKRLEDFDRVNNIYKSYFSDNPPARSTVEVSNLPKDARIEIEAIACR